ncbi:DBH-like monooxygenase protein 1 [Desmophyllum pertusum]|uniref:DBH-like monooxygenase protein 1 n=1 Tax=Desmophyllum pertusum TaxID=174260 RepID=A0A9X0DBF3_9CNID|nr:DBH-like monooxygenase protein 1 [Desmophyllum pertusum]
MSHKLSLLAVFVLCFHHGIDGFRDTSLSFDNGNFNVSWMYNRARDELYFEVTVKTKGWVGFGFTFTPHNMSNYDIIIGGQTRRGKPYFNDFFTTGFSTPVLDLKQSYTVDRATEHDGITSLHFHRPMNTNDSQDIQFNVGTRVFLVWAYHFVDDASDPSSFSMHSRRNHTSESHQLVFETVPTMLTNHEYSRTVLTSSPEPSSPAAPRPAKSFGLQVDFSFLTISFVTVLHVLSILV